MYKCNNETRSRSLCCRGKLNIKHYDSVSVFSSYLTDKQIASFLLSIILLSVYSLALPQFFKNISQTTRF